MERGNKGIGDVLSTLTVAVLFLVILLLVVYSASSYQHGVTYQNDSDNTRAVLSYVVTAVKDNNTADVEPADFDGMPGIRIRNTAIGYEQRIYLSDGRLLEEYVRSDLPVDPSTAMEIGTVQEFEVTYVSDGLLRVRTDVGTSYVKTEK